MIASKRGCVKKPKRESKAVSPQSVEVILTRLRSMADPKLLVQEQRLGIDISKGLGISVWDLRKLAKGIGKDQPLAEKLWKTGIREARLLAGYVSDPATISEKTIEAWAADFNSWDIVDQVADVIWLSPHGRRKAGEWSRRPEEFVKRAGFVLMAGLASEKDTSDADLERFLAHILREATDERNFVKKAVNWALRNIGKRNRALNKKAIQIAEQISQIDDPTARWIARDALKELTSEKTRARLESKKT